MKMLLDRPAARRCAHHRGRRGGSRQDGSGRRRLPRHRIPFGALRITTVRQTAAAPGGYLLTYVGGWGG